ncbi:hypothetical protein Bhyg_02576, partial [Pseudolycoriella hygida]
HVSAQKPSNSQDWNKLLCKRIRHQFGSKRVNTFLVDTPNTIGGDFPLKVPRYGTSKNMFWSNKPRNVSVMLLGSSSGKPNYYVYDCGQMYYVAALDHSRRPIHYEGQS